MPTHRARRQGIGRFVYKFAAHTFAAAETKRKSNPRDLHDESAV
jgi:hypothetical protein